MGSMPGLMAEADERLADALAGRPRRRPPTTHHVTLKATTTATSTEEGTFTAVISSTNPDREQDVVDADALVAAIHSWVTAGKRIPLQWGHSTAVEDLIGSVDPVSARNVNGEVIVTGRVDRTSARGRRARSRPRPLAPPPRG
jgi:hypothetical protein